MREHNTSRNNSNGFEKRGVQRQAYNVRYGVPPLFAIIPGGINERMRARYSRFAAKCIKSPPGCGIGFSLPRSTNGAQSPAATAMTALDAPPPATFVKKGELFGYNELTDDQLGLDACRYDYNKAPDGCMGDWTNLAAGLPRRGEGSMGHARINIGNRKAAQGEAEATCTANALNHNTPAPRIKTKAPTSPLPKMPMATKRS